MREFSRHVHPRSVATPPPEQTGGQVLYLDFDGVLHPADVWRRPGIGPYVASPPGHTVLEHAGLLDEILAPYPGVRIVLSTNWVVVYGSVLKVVRRLPVRLRDRVVGATFHGDMDANRFREMPRGKQVCSDVVRRRPHAWLALDDHDEGWPIWSRDHLVITNPVLGISDSQVMARLLEKLAGFLE
ncbi:hypothetical protein LMG28690_05801 [Paraburkholderia caffeinilytica]|nr:hypothetical protein LMG28690_05801 [Paraburkholderia caffeinilytica]